MKSELEEIIKNSNNSKEHLQDGILGPRIISAYKKLETEKRRADEFYMFSLGYARSPFRDFESYLQFAVALDVEAYQRI